MFLLVPGICGTGCHPELIKQATSVSSFLFVVSLIKLLCSSLAFIVQQIFLLSRDWSKRIKRLNIPQLKLGNNRVIFPNF